MRLLTIALLGGALLLPSLASAHPEGVMSSSLGVGSWMTAIPGAGPGEESPGTAGTTGTNAGTSKNMHREASIPKRHGPEGLQNFNTYIAFWVSYAIAGNYDGIQIID